MSAQHIIGHSRQSTALVLITKQQPNNKQKHMGTVVVHNTAQNSSDNLPSYPPDNHHSSDKHRHQSTGNDCVTTSITIRLQNTRNT